MRRVTAESFLVSAQGHHLVELSDAADNNCELTNLFRLRAMLGQAACGTADRAGRSAAPSNIHPLFVGQGHDVTGVPACAPPCFGNKGSKLREADASVDLLHRPFMALLLLFLGDSLAGHGYLQGSEYRQMTSTEGAIWGLWIGVITTWIVTGFFTRSAAKGKGRDGTAWFLAGLLWGPLQAVEERARDTIAMERTPPSTRAEWAANPGDSLGAAVCRLIGAGMADQPKTRGRCCAPRRPRESISPCRGVPGDPGQGSRSRPHRPGSDRQLLGGPRRSALVPDAAGDAAGSRCPHLRPRHQIRHHGGVQR